LGYLASWGVKLERFLMTQPIRTCVGCRHREPQTKLIRIILADQQVTPNKSLVDFSKKAPGRGAYLHLDPKCINTAVSRKLLARALKAHSNLDTTEVTDLINSN